MNFADLHCQLRNILGQSQLTTLFQPIMDMHDGQIYGYEALSRGPSDSALHAPQALFNAAEHFGMVEALDLVCFEKALQSFAQLALPGRVFVNVSPGTLLTDALDPAAVLERLNRLGLERRQLVLEVTESAPTFDYAPLKEVVERLRVHGLDIAMDDLGEGFSSLRLWSELKPAYVKIDKHFISAIHQDPHKLQFVRSIQQIAENAQAHVIAEGVELASEQCIIKDLAISFAQGYLIGRPAAIPARVAPQEALLCISSGKVSVFPSAPMPVGSQVKAEKVLIQAPWVSSHTASEMVLEIMLDNPELHALAVVDNGQPVGVIQRPALQDRFTRLFSRELYGKRPCCEIMDPDPLVVDKGTLIRDLSELVVRKGKQAFISGFIITDEGRYVGMGSGFDLMRELTELQIVAARYSNPLTGLPGNVPIQEHLERLLASAGGFVVAYFDLNAFKPYNDVYGFRRGDDMIGMMGRLLSAETSLDLDFVGHIGGDDFVVLFQSPDWEARCKRILGRFDELRCPYFSPEHQAAGGYRSENRRGEQEFHALVTLAIGAVHIDSEHFDSYHEVARAAAEAKRMAKRADGHSLFIDRRRRPFVQQSAMPKTLDTPPTEEAHHG